MTCLSSTSSSRRRLCLAGLASALFVTVAGAQVLPAPLPRARAYDIPLENHEAVLETESMIAVATSVYVDQQVVTPGNRWERVRFSDPDGSNVTERNILSSWDAQSGSVAQGSDVFLHTSTSYRVVNRDPAIPVRNFGGLSTWELGAITDDYIILHTDAGQDGDFIEFRDRQSFDTVGQVLCKNRPVKMVALENEIIFASVDAKGASHFHRMPYPDFSKGSPVKVKITNIPGTFTSIPHFGPNFAVAHDAQAKTHVIRWSDPAKGGKAGDYPLNEYYTLWTEANGKLLRYDSLPFRLWETRFVNKGVSFEPIGVPPVVSEAWLMPTTGSGLFFKGPPAGNTNLDGIRWFQRVNPVAGHQVTVPPVSASERDGVMHFTVKLDRAATAPVNFSYETAGATAVSGVDFEASSGSRTIAVGQSEAIVDVVLTEDFVIERPETLQFRITGLSGAFCDEPVASGRITGSGLRVNEDVADDDGVISSTLSSEFKWSNAQRVLSFPAGSASAAQHGFVSFNPIAGNGGAYYYAHGTSSGLLKICQFDATSGELLEVFPDAPRKRDGDSFLVGKGAGYVRYGFFDGFPALGLEEGTPVPEGSGAQDYVLKSERSKSVPYSFTATWVDPGTNPGPVSIVNQSDTGDFVMNFAPVDDSIPGYQQPLGLRVDMTHTATAATSTLISYVSIADNDVVQATAHVPTTTVAASALAAHGNRLWLGQNFRTLLESYEFKAGVLKPVAKLTLPKNNKAQWAEEGRGSGYAIAFDGQRVAAGVATNLSQNMAVISAAATAKPKAKIVATNFTPISHVLVPGYVVMSRTQTFPGSQAPVYLYDAKGKVARTITSIGGDTSSFGYSMAVAGDILWIGAPLLNGAGGRVEGYSMSNNFTLVRTLTSPAPVTDGVYGFSISSSGPYLVVGEPSVTAPGAAWVYSADGSTMLKRLGSGATSGQDGFGAQVATRNNRILTGTSPLGEFFDYANPGQIIVDNPGLWSGHQPVMLWENLNALPKRIMPTTAGTSSGQRIALLDDCAVFTSRTATAGGLDVYEFGATASVASSSALAALSVGTTPAVWPAEGASRPQWSFATTGQGVMELSVDLGAAPVDASDLAVEWSGDLVQWTKIAGWNGSVISAQHVSSASTEGGVLKVALMPSATGSGFFRLTSGKD